MKLELLYVEGCSSWHQALENLRQAYRTQGVALKVSLLRVAGAHHARALRFQGCPSIRLAGKELFPGQPGEYGLVCRLFSTDQGLRGWPSEQMIRQRL